MKRTRQEKIAAQVEAAGRVKVSDLSEQLGVSEMTVRRDLEDLEDSGVLLRLHGGAVSNISRSYEPGFEVRHNLNTDAKMRIGKLAASLIRDRETIVFDAGSTTLHVVENIPSDLHIRAMALSLRIAAVLSDLPNVTVMTPGGTVRRGERSFIGGAAVAGLEKLTFDSLFLTVGGISSESGVTEYEVDDAEIKKEALLSTKRVIVVADGSKLGATAFVRICEIENIDVLVTDREAPEAEVEALRKLGVEVLLA
jgi:DeoR/GlpR family transcriptional regulator of sugar metabolism